MALFYLIAKKKDEFNWSMLHSQISNSKPRFISIFPISRTIGASFYGLGLTASSKYINDVQEVKMEVANVAQILWRNQFTIVDLYEGEEIPSQSYSTLLRYL